jgi:SAM-dependent methyltransferase
MWAMQEVSSFASGMSQEVRAFYELHPYPPPVDDLDRYRQSWDADRRRAESHLFWPDEPYRDDRSILVAGCGTSQAAKVALRWPHARVTGIDVSATSIASTELLRRKYRLDNLELRQLPVEQATELNQGFEHIICTGVLHHLPDPDRGLRALRDVLMPRGAMHVMVYALHGRAGVYLLQDYCRRLGIGTTQADIRELAATLGALPPDHPLMPLLRTAPDFRSEAGLADALLHPQDRAYSVPQMLDWFAAAGLAFGRWVRQAAYRPQCGAPASTPHGPRLSGLPIEQQYAALELLRGTMLRHSAVIYRDDRPSHRSVEFDADDWLGYVPIRLPDTIVVEERLPPGAAAVLINRSHTYTDLFLPIDREQKRWVDAIDGERAIGQIVATPQRSSASRDFFERLWWYDQVVFDLTRSQASQ